MPKNKLTDLNNHIFAQLERLNDEDLSEEKLAMEVSRAKAIAMLAAQAVKNAQVALIGMRMMHDGTISSDATKLLGTTSAEDL